MTVTTTVVTIPTKIHCIVPREHVHRTASDVPIIAVFLLHGTVTEMTTVEMELMNLQNIANPKDEPALVICLLVTTETVYLEFTFVTGTTTVWIIPMRMIVINAVSSRSGRVTVLLVVNHYRATFLIFR